MSEVKSEERQEKPNWIKMKPAELEKLVIDLGKAGKNPAEIGMILRDQHGIPKAKLLGKKIAVILKENKVAYQTEKEAMAASIDNVKKHIAQHKHDYTSKKSLAKKLWHVKRLD